MSIQSHYDVSYSSFFHNSRLIRWIQQKINPDCLLSWQPLQPLQYNVCCACMGLWLITIQAWVILSNSSNWTKTSSFWKKLDCFIWLTWQADLFPGLLCRKPEPYILHLQLVQPGFSQYWDICIMWKTRAPKWFRFGKKWDSVHSCYQKFWKLSKIFPS